MKRFVLVVAAVMSTCALVWPAAGQAYDTGPHAEITNAAMGAEGFGSDANKLGQVNNWFTDLYHSLGAENIPFSGHAGWFKRTITLAASTENWPQKVVNASTRMHFDNNPLEGEDARNINLGNAAGLSAEWDRLRKVVWTLAREARDENNPAKLLAVIGVSTHQLQDFYAHTNWIEPRLGHGVAGSDGPGWPERGYGTSPTWFDVPAEVRDQLNLYGDSTAGHRPHEIWKSDGNTSVEHAMTRDWEGRPYYMPSAISAYFATRQWIQAVRLWVADDAFWARAQQFAANRPQLERDAYGRFLIMNYAGHWHGGGEPIGADNPGAAGSLPELIASAKKYFKPKPGESGFREPKTEYRVNFEKLIQRLAEPYPAGQLGPVPSSQELQRQMKIVVFKVTKMNSHGLGDPGPDDADMYARAEVDGQRFNSSTMHGYDNFSFPNPYEPFTFFKPVPANPDRAEPVTDVTIEVTTGDVRWAGTGDDVDLRLGAGNGMVFRLDKKGRNEFERGDTDTFSVPIDEAIKAGLTVGDITECTIYKSSDGISGGWRLGGLKLKVNGRVAYSNPKINRWLEDNHRSWRAPDFVRRNPHGSGIPVWLSLGEDDFVYGGDDLGDINPHAGRRVTALAYQPGAPVELTTRGGNRYGGTTGDGSEAAATFRLETITPETFTASAAPQPPRPPQVAPATAPDLVITEFFFKSVTIENRGTAPSPPFRFSARRGLEQKLVNFPAIPAGASLTLPVGLTCGERATGIADDLEQVPELDESNNEARSQVCDL